VRNSTHSPLNNSLISLWIGFNRLLNIERRYSKEMRISNLMERQVLRIDEDSTVQRAAEVMGEKHVGSLLVTRGYEDVGIITERDVLSRVIAKKRSLDEVKVKEVMSHPVITVEKDSNGETVLKTMYEQRVRRVFVTEEGKIVGIFSTSDITKLARMNL